MKHLTPLFAAALLLATPSAAQGATWTQVSTPVGPSIRAQHAMAYDSSRGKVVLFGGHDVNGTQLNDTWEYDGTNWAQITTTNSPSARENHAMVFDSTRSKVVLFGGSLFGSRLNDTWEYDGAGWAQVPTPSPPLPNARQQMVYDHGRSRVVMFGGDISGDKTWEYDGMDWTLISTPTSPQPRWQHGMAYDPARGLTVMFGGDANGGNFGDTWEYDGTNWMLSPAVGPVGREDHHLVFDGLSSRTLAMFGASNQLGPTQPLLADVWQLDAMGWTPLNTTGQPPARRGSCAVFDNQRNVVVMFGGSDNIHGHSRSS